MNAAADDIPTLRRILKDCRTVAVVGLSDQWHRPSYFVAKYLQDHGYRVIPVNPRYAGGTILGEKVFASVTSAKDAGERTRRGVAYKVVQAQADPKGELMMTFYIDPKDSIARQAEFVTKSAGRTKTSVLNTSSLALTASETLFAFTAPAGSKEVQEADLVAGKWYYNFEEAKGIAKSTGKIMMVDFMATWCGPCKMMDAEVFTTARFKNEAKDFVLVKIDVDQQKDVAGAYNVTAMPTVMFINGDGQVVHKFIGYGGPEAVFGEMAKAKSMR